MTGYECRTCGHEPNAATLAQGSCPRCSGIRLAVWKSLPAQLDALPLGSSLQVVVRAWSSGGYGSSGSYRLDTVFLWTSVDRFADGTPVWCSKKGRTTFVSNGEDQPVYVQRYAETRFHDPYRMTSAAVAHFTVGEMTYGAAYVIHDNTPQPTTEQFRTQQRIMEDMGWPQP